MDVTSTQAIETGDFAPWSLTLWPPNSMRVVDWNIDRGLHLRGVVEFLGDAKADLLILQEVDVNAKRTHRLNVAREIAQKLQMNYVWGREFHELTQGTRSSPAFHGQATLSPWPLSSARVLKFQRQSNLWHPRWYLPDMEPFQERIGGRMGLVVDVNLAGRWLVSYNMHIESRGDASLRQAQLRECLRDSKQYKPRTPIVLAGDMNLNIARYDLVSDLKREDFKSPFTDQQIRTTPAKSLLDRGSHRLDFYARPASRHPAPSSYLSYSLGSLSTLPYLVFRVALLEPGRLYRPLTPCGFQRCPRSTRCQILDSDI